jgi:acetyl-CoA synthetase
MDVTLKENRKFSPPASFIQDAACRPERIARWRELAKKDFEGYWAEAARELQWDEPWKRVLKWEAPHAEWYGGGKLNASVNCLDRHLGAQPHKAAIVWEAETGEVTTWTYQELHFQVERLAAALRKLGYKKGERVAIYMPLVPEAAVAMLACARLGLVHTVVFGGFSGESLKDRIQDAKASALITADFGYRKGAKVDLLAQVVKAEAACPTLRDTIVLRREYAGQLTAPATRSYASPVAGVEEGARPARCDWHELMASVDAQSVVRDGKPESVDSEHPLFILYTSGTTGKPKGIVHTTGGYLTGALRSCKLVFDLKPTDLYWCTADVGWITGHTYLVYGPLAAGASIFMYEGAPMTPTPDRFWAMIERHKISILYTAPTAIRAFMKLGDEHPRGRDLSSLRLLGSVGEPINPEAWMWYHREIGREQCPIVDTFWQTETGSIVISPLPQEMATKPGSATLPLPGYDVDVVNREGQSVPLGEGGLLVIRKPWPSMARTIHGDDERFLKTYFSEFKEPLYFTGDGARRDEDGYIWCLGRVDDVLNISGHRLGTMEVESALVSHPYVAEAAAVGRPDDLKGQALVVFVTLKSNVAPEIRKDLERVSKELKAHVAQEIGALARPDDVRLAEALPKTRSGKIMRRLLRELATQGRVSGDTTTLEDLSVVAALTASEE